MNVTLSIPEDILTLAREKAARQSTSINNLIRQFLEDYSAISERETIADEALSFFASISPVLPPDAKITREEMEER